MTRRQAIQCNPLSSVAAWPVLCLDRLTRSVTLSWRG